MNLIEATLRESTTKGQLAKLREQGNLPAIVYGGKDGLVWNKVGCIVLSWILSPLLAGLFSAITFYFINRFIFTNRFKCRISKSIEF